MEQLEEITGVANSNLTISGSIDDIKDLVGIICTSGQQGPAGKDGHMTFDDLTPEQKEQLRGPQGIPGKDGKDGKDGIDGAQGPQGDRGPIGLQGVKGDKGEPGKDGVDGATGPKGDKGDKGDPGETIEYTAGTGIDITNNVISATGTELDNIFFAYHMLGGEETSVQDIIDAIEAGKLVFVKCDCYGEQPKYYQYNYSLMDMIYYFSSFDAGDITSIAIANGSWVDSTTTNYTLPPLPDNNSSYTLKCINKTVQWVRD